MTSDVMYFFTLWAILTIAFKDKTHEIHLVMNSLVDVGSSCKKNLKALFRSLLSNTSLFFQRFPVITWRHPRTKGLLLRASAFQSRNPIGMLRHNPSSGLMNLYHWLAFCD